MPAEKKTTKKTLLAISAHPDDIEFGCTGIMMKLIEKKYDAFLVIATNGESGSKLAGKSKKERIEVRKKEQMRAAELLGIKKVYFLDYKDGFLENDESLRKKLVKIIKDVKPEILFSFDPANRRFDDLNIHHRDHRHLSTAVFDAVFAAKNAFLYPGKPHIVSKLYFYASAEPNHFEDITEYMERKLEILKAHKSQFSDFSKVEKMLREYFSSYSKENKYSEPFRVLDVIAKF